MRSFLGDRARVHRLRRPFSALRTDQWLDAPPDGLVLRDNFDIFRHYGRVPAWFRCVPQSDQVGRFRSPPPPSSLAGFSSAWSRIAVDARGTLHAGAHRIDLVG